MKHVCVIRIAVFSFVVCSMLCNTLFDSILEYTWKYLKATSFIKHDSCEPLLSVIVFGILIHSFRYLDQRCPSVHQYRIGYSSKKFAKPLPRDQFFGMKHEFWTVVWYLLPICAFDFLYPRRILTENSPGWFEFSTQLCLGVFLYDFIFYWVHLAFHKSKHLLRFHKTHHLWSNEPLRASETVRLSPLDAGLQVGVNILVQNIMPNKHPMTRLAHNIAIIYLLVEAHSGYDFPFFTHNVCPLVFGGSIRHSIHHQRGDVYFQQFFKYLDDLFGFVPRNNHAMNNSNQNNQNNTQIRLDSKMADWFFNRDEGTKQLLRQCMSKLRTTERPAQPQRDPPPPPDNFQNDNCI